MDDVTLRIIMATLAAVLIFTHSLWTGDEWRRSSLPVIVGRVGLNMLFLYVLSGQIKAIRLHIPVDAYTYLGLLSLVLSAFGFGWEVVRRFRRQGTSA